MAALLKSAAGPSRRYAAAQQRCRVWRKPDIDLSVASVVSDVVRIERTLNSTQITKIIADVQARKAGAIEQRRRVEWHRRELAASRFRAEYDQAGAAATSRP